METEFESTRKGNIEGGGKWTDKLAIASHCGDAGGEEEGGDDGAPGGRRQSRSSITTD